MNRKILLLSVILLNSFLSAQTFSLLGEIGNFKSAASFSFNAMGNIYVSDIETNKIFKLDTLGKVLKSYGGYGWDENGFDQPLDIHANSLKVYVTDYNNSSIKIFDKDLNYISYLNGKSSNSESGKFRYPVYCRVSKQGDLYLLDSEENRILKFGFTSNFISDIGGYDAGSFELENPVSFSIDQESNLYVLDGKRILVFDKFGNGVSQFNTEFEFNSISVTGTKMIVTTDSEIYSLNNVDQSLKKVNIFGITDLSEIKGATFFKRKLYVLTRNSIFIFSRLN